MRFTDQQALETFLQDIQEDYAVYAASLWAFGVRSRGELANGSVHTLQQAGITNPLHAENIKAEAAGSSIIAAGKSFDDGVEKQLVEGFAHLTTSIDQLCDNLKRYIADNSSQTVDASKVTIEEVELIESAMRSRRVYHTVKQLNELQADGLYYEWIEGLAEDDTPQVGQVLAFLQDKLLSAELEQRFSVIDVNKKAAAAFPKASFAGLPRFYRGRADYLVLPRRYEHLTDASDQRKCALVVFEVKKELAEIKLAQARLGFLTYGSYSNAALLYVFTDLVHGGILFWARQLGDELQVHQTAVDGMKQLFQEVRVALQHIPDDVMGGGTNSRPRAPIGRMLQQPERDKFSISGLQHPQLLPGQLLRMAFARLESSSPDEQDLKAWYPTGDSQQPLRFDTDDAQEQHAEVAAGWMQMFG